MKRLLSPCALLLAASACSTTPQPGNTSSANTPANTNANAANTSATPKAEANAVTDAVFAKEKEIWDEVLTKNSAGFGALLADDFIYVTSDGVYDKAGTVNGIKQIDATETSFSDWKVVMLDKDAAVVTYTVNLKGTSMGQPLPGTPMRGASAWVNRGGTWIGVYHQDTMVNQTPPAGPASSPQAATHASPAAAAGVKPSETTSDVTANEKMVWDAIKRKDANAFANFLTEDSIEVEPIGVYDKSGSVKGITMVDASKVTLSDFKTLKLNDNATLVTYLVKGPSPDFEKLGERHSTVWINRGGKWLAAFHEGTPVTPPPAAAKAAKK